MSRNAILVGSVLLLVSTGCGGSDGAGGDREAESAVALQAAHPDGVTYHGVVHFVATPTTFRPLDTIPTDRPYSAVTWRGGRITSVVRHRALGGAAETIHVEYPETGGVRYVWLNAYGVLDRTEDISADGTYTREMRSGIRTHRGCSSLGPTFFKDGLLAMESCRDPDGRAVIDENGCQSVHYRWSEEGNLQESACFDEYGTAVLDAQGVHKTTYRVDERGLEVERAFFDSSAQPLGRASDGCARWRTGVDERGLQVAGTCLDAGGLATEIANSRHAGWTAQYDSNGCLAVRKYVTTSGDPSERARIAEDHYINDPRCGVLEESHHDRKGGFRQPSSWKGARSSTSATRRDWYRGRSATGQAAAIEPACTWARVAGRSSAGPMTSVEGWYRRGRSRRTNVRPV